MRPLYVSATRQTSGKTAVSIGLCAALTARGIPVQAFKKGPDYIDPLWLARASARPCFNLDFRTMGREEILGYLRQRGSDAGLCLVEGNKGLHDGVDPGGGDSNAALAKLLDAEVVLVVDAQGMTRGVAPLVLGQSAFDAEVRFRGVILNNVRGARHESKLRAALERYTDLEVLGAIPRDPRMRLDMRHLGLVPCTEQPDADRLIAGLAQCLEANVAIDALLPARPPVSARRPAAAAANAREPDLRIAIARDPAFGFYYPDDLEMLEREGARLLSFDTLRDRALPRADALFIGGGFPERHLAALEANEPLRGEIRRAIDSGMPAYAECGGLMYLTRSIEWKGERRVMVGAIDAETRVHPHPVGRGYTHLAATSEHPWGGHASSPEPFHAHEFHYSELAGLPRETRFGFRVLRGAGVDGEHDGIVVNNVLACYCHQRAVGTRNWARDFVAFIRARRGR